MTWFCDRKISTSAKKHKHEDIWFLEFLPIFKHELLWWKQNFNHRNPMKSLLNKYFYPPPPRNLSNQTRQCFDGSTRYGLSEDQLQALLGRAGAEANGLVFTVRVAQWKGEGDSKHWQQTFAASWKIWVRSTSPVCWYNNLRSWKENCRSRWANFPLKQMLPQLFFLEPSMRWGYHHVRVMHSPDTEVNAAVFALQVLFGGVAWLGVGSATKTSSRCRGTTSTRTRQFQPHFPLIGHFLKNKK